MTDETRPDLHLVEADDVTFEVETSNAAPGEAAEEELLSVWVPLATRAVAGTINSFGVVLFHVIAHDPSTNQQGAFVLALGREEALAASKQLHDASRGMPTIQAQIRERTAQINKEAPRG